MLDYPRCNMQRGRNYRQTPLVRKRFRWRVPLVYLCSAVLIFSVVMLTMYQAHSNENRAQQAELSARHKAELQQEQAGETVAANTEAPTATPEVVSAAASLTAAPLATTAPKQTFFQVIGLTRSSLKSFVKQNDDTVGWLTIEGLVDQPVVYRDNSYYLTHDFNKHSNSCGAIFMDMNTPIHSDTQNLLIYGHNMRDGSMFGRLIKYIKSNYLHNHYIVRFDTRIESFTYLIFAVDQVSLDYTARNFLNFARYSPFYDEDDFNAYIDDVYEHSLYTRYLDVDYTDTLLTLVTCIGDDRLILVARRQRENETESEIQHCLLNLCMR